MTVPTLTVAQATKPFSRSMALVFVDGSVELLHEVAEAALAETPGLAARVAAAVRSADAREVREAAHSLKGILQCLGALPAAGCARELEQMGRGGDLTRAAAVLSVLEREIEKFVAALRAAMA